MVLPHYASLLSFRRRLPRWKVSSARLTSKILAHHETCADPQMLASIASVVGSGSLDGGCAGGLSQGGDHMASFDRYMDCYAERCSQWGAEDKRAETMSHQREAHNHPHDVQTPAKPIGEQGGLQCSVCDKLVDGRPLLCQRCGHGGHSKHIAVSSEVHYARHKLLRRFVELVFFHVLLLAQKLSGN